MTLTLPTTANGDGGVVGVCGRARPELAALGDLGAPLVAVLGSVEQAGAGRDVSVLADPGFALDVLSHTPPCTDPAVVGRVLDFLRTRAGHHSPAPATASVARVTVADAVASYEAGALTLLADSTQSKYRRWARRLVAEHGADGPDAVTTGDLKDLIARWVIEARLSPKALRDAGSVEADAVTAYRHLWTYFRDKRWATSNIAKELRKPPEDDANRRPFRVEEAALLRHLVRGLAQDPVDVAIVALEEFLGLRRIELCRLRFCHVHLDRPDPYMRVYGKGNKYRDMPIGPHLLRLLTDYVESVRPAGVNPGDWARSEELFLRTPPNSRYPQGRRVGVPGRLFRIFTGLHAAAPDVFADGALTPHCYRASLGSFVDARWSRAVTKEVLGHKGRKTPTDHYVYIDPATIREVICAYEAHLLAADPTVTTSTTEEVDQ